MKFLFVLLLFCILFLLYIRYLENASLFYPAKLLRYTPEKIDLIYEDVYILTQDRIKLHGWFVPGGEGAATILFFHGNAGNISDRLGKLQLFNQLGYNVFIIDYRGYGLSEGKPTEKSLYVDALAAYQYLIKRSDIDRKKLVCYGASLGGVPAVDLALKREFVGLIIDSSFSNAKDMAKRFFPFIPSFLISLELDSLNKIKQIKIPKLFIHSKEDMTVPFELGYKLYKEASLPKEFLEISGGHNDGHIYSEEKFRNKIREFVDKL